MTLPAGCFFEETPKTQLPIKGKTIEDVLNVSNRSVRIILHKEELQYGALVFYLPDFRSSTEAESQLGLEYIEETERGWELNYKGGMYSSGIEELVYFEFFPDDNDITSPLPLFYGEIKSSEIEEVLVINLNSENQYKAKIINLDKKPGMKNDMRVWFVTVDETHRSNFKIKGIGNTGDVIFSEMAKLQSGTAPMLIN